MAMAVLKLESGSSLTIAPSRSQMEATMEPEAGSKSAPTIVPFEFTAVAEPKKGPLVE